MDDEMKVVTSRFFSSEKCRKKIAMCGKDLRRTSYAKRARAAFGETA
jgi:hypothetical protein